MSTVMTSPALLFLLLMSSCLSVSSVPQSASPGEPLHESDQNQRSMLKKLGSWLKSNFRGIGEVAVASIEPIPGVGAPIAGAIKTLLLLAPKEDPLADVHSEIKALTVKLDTLRSEMRWDAWAAGAYQKPVNNIENAWTKYTELVISSKQTTATEKEALKTNFFNFYGQYADSTWLLHQFLTAEPASMTQNLGDALADRLRCHEKDIKAQFLYLNQLMCKGNMLNEKYYEFKGTNTDVKLKRNAADEIVSQSASALFASHKRCISDSATYIERDIFERIDGTKKHQKIADHIRDFLVKTYDRYDWVVVAFTTKNSKHKPKLLKRHALSGFTEVTRGTVTVAVAKQVKGDHTKTAAVQEAIKKCLPEICLDVAETLMKCQQTVFGKSLSQTYTAVHTYKKKSQTSTNVEEEPNDEDTALPESAISSSLRASHLFTGNCGKIFGKFMVLIKSDEEMMGGDPCSKKKCGQNGKCATVPGTFIAMCECQYPYYGEHCEKSLESYKKQLQLDPERGIQTPGTSASRRSTSPSSSSSLKSSVKRRSRKSSSRSSLNRRSRKSSSASSVKRRSRKSSSASSVKRRSRKSSSRSSINRRSRKSSSASSVKRRSRKSSSASSVKRRSRKSSSRSSLNRRSRKSSSASSVKRRSRKSSSASSVKRRSRKSSSRSSINRRSRKSSSASSVNRRSQKTPKNSATGQRDAKSFCGSLCNDKTNGFL